MELKDCINCLIIDIDHFHIITDRNNKELSPTVSEKFKILNNEVNKVRQMAMDFYKEVC